MIKIPETSPCYLTINQSEASQYTATLTANVAFKNPPLRAIRESGSFEHESSIFFAWCLANRYHISSYHNMVSVNLIGFAMLRVNRSKFIQFGYSQM